MTWGAPSGPPSPHAEHPGKAGALRDCPSHGAGPERAPQAPHAEHPGKTGALRDCPSHGAGPERAPQAPRGVGAAEPYRGNPWGTSAAVQRQGFTRHVARVNLRGAAADGVSAAGVTGGDRRAFSSSLVASPGVVPMRLRYSMRASMQRR